ncbi:hypothetical protein GWI33_005377 [Rhynchophorus ferrugineus]|uniref:Uncharacterized protein n=1 Tax=Rhynchophorus ferrugineus TaxID=354439 RepID=A0A834IK57_RHYFE|nr:hypothetical protein GWI33_005377 [Rhynchophorus ferrugineus]
MGHSVRDGHLCRQVQGGHMICDGRRRSRLDSITPGQTDVLARPIYVTVSVKNTDITRFRRPDTRSRIPNCNVTRKIRRHSGNNNLRPDMDSAPPPRLRWRQVYERLGMRGGVGRSKPSRKIPDILGIGENIGKNNKRLLED